MTHDSHSPIRSVVIVGGGITGWLAALALARVAGARGAAIRLIEPEKPAHAEPEAEGTLPAIRTLLRILRIEERDFVRAAHGTYKLGTQFCDWAASGSRHFHPYGDLGAAIDTLGFHHHWLRVQEQAPLEAFSLAAVAATAGRFAHPVTDPASPLSMLDYGFHVDISACARFLREHAERAGVQRTCAGIADVRLRGADGFIEAVILQDGTEVAGDLFLDCTGAHAALIGKALGTSYETWQEWLPCDRTIQMATRARGNQSPSTSATACDAGWRWRIPLQDRIDHGLVYCSRYTRDEDAEAMLLGSIDSPPLAQPRVQTFTAGRRAQLWNRNCVALGSAAAFLEPLESTFLHLTHSAISKLVALFPWRNAMANESAEFNRLMGGELERLRDWIILHYASCARTDSPLWESCRAMRVPDSLARKIDLFASRGRVVLYDEEVLPEASWICAFTGLGIRPRRTDPRAERLPADQVREHLHRMRTAIMRAAEAMPPHQAVIERMTGIHQHG